MISLWWEILKNAKISGKATGQGKSLDASKIKINIDKGDCLDKLKKVHVFIGKYAKEIEPILKKTLVEINKNNPPMNKKKHSDGKEGTSPLLFEKEVMTGGQEGTVSYIMPTEINRGAIRINISNRFNPIPEEDACKLIELFNSEQAVDMNIFTDYYNDPPLGVQRKKGTSDLGYSAPKLFLTVGPYTGVIPLKLGISMSMGWFDTYDNQREHTKVIFDAIRLNDAYDKIISILK